MTKLSFSRQFLRRRDSRRRLKCNAVVECRGVSRKIEVVDFSTDGLRLDGVTGLATGDHVLILLTPELSVEGVIAWSVWHKAGVKLLRPLAENDEVYLYLADQAAAMELARTRAVAALVQQHANRAPRPDTD
jgi:hypothetical protein